MSKRLAIVILAFACFVVAAKAQDDGGDAGGDFSVSSGTYTGSDGCSMGYCDSTFGSSYSSSLSGDSSVDLSAWDGVSQRFVDGLQSSQITWQDGVPMPTSEVQSEANSLQSALTAVAGTAEAATDDALNTVPPAGSWAAQQFDGSVLPAIAQASEATQALEAGHNGSTGSSVESHESQQFGKNH